MLKELFFPLVAYSNSQSVETFDSFGNSYLDNNSRIATIIGWTIHIILMVLAGYLAYRCNGPFGASNKSITNVLNVVVAVLFSYLYIPYYVLRYYILNDQTDCEKVIGKAKPEVPVQIQAPAQVAPVTLENAGITEVKTE